jgi:hypothetical protein
MHSLFFDGVGSQVALWSIDEANPVDADENRLAAAGVRLAGWKLSADDIC